MEHLLVLLTEAEIEALKLKDESCSVLAKSTESSGHEPKPK